MYATRGNALFLILIAVALFAALSYAVTQSSRGGGASIKKEQDMLDAGVAEQCMAYVERGVNLLTLLNNCPERNVSYELPNGLNENPNNPSNKSCFLFDPEGAGLTPCSIYAGAGCSNAILSGLQIGQVGCGQIVYAGMSGGNRIYTTLVDQPGKLRYGNLPYVNTGATSVSDGLANTNTLIAETTGTPYSAALACRGLGAEWYLPARDETGLFYTNRALIGGFDTSEQYWSSTEAGSSHAAGHRNFSTGGFSPSVTKNTLEKVRCARR